MSVNSEWQVTGSARLGKRYTSCDPGAQAHPMCICGKDAACGLLSDGLFCLGKVRRAILDGGKITEFRDWEYDFLKRLQPITDSRS